jgi:predicted ATPase/DNA-binding SARP family transcriptional activator
MASLSISLLGTFQVALNGWPITDLRTDKARALLAYLAVEAKRPHRRDALAGLLWADRPHTRARQSLRQALSHLRRALGDHKRSFPFLLIERETIQFNPDGDYRLDVAAFTILSEMSRTHRHHSLERCLPCLQRMEAMAGLDTGRFLEGFCLSDSQAFEEWATLQREYLQRQIVEALAYLVEYYRRRGDMGRAILAAHRQVQLEPWREETHRQLMWLLALGGQRSAALAQYGVCQRLLAAELAVQPTKETTALYEEIRDRSSLRIERSFQPAPSPRHNLPPSSTPFVGRDEELADLADLMSDPDCRLVTLIGPGGIGKTRLALQVAAGQVGLFAQGVTYVPLATLRSADLLVPATAHALQLQFHSQENAEQQLLDFLRAKEMLLVLDSMECVLDGSDLLAKILLDAPEVVLLVTSRQRLNLHEEWAYHVDGLAYPGTPTTEELETFGAIALFVQTARRAHRKFLLTEGEGTHVARICQLVEGMPLAVELAAASIPARTCEEIAMELERDLDTLATSLRNMPARHRSLSAAFEHSWRLLSEGERAALCQLSRFPDGFGAEAAEQVAGASSQMLTSLVDKSLLRRSTSGRYEMHRILKWCAAQKLKAASPLAGTAEHP